MEQLPISVEQWQRKSRITALANDSLTMVQNFGHPDLQTSNNIFLTVGSMEDLMHQQEKETQGALLCGILQAVIRVYNKSNQLLRATAC